MTHASSSHVHTHPYLHSQSRVAASRRVLRSLARPRRRRRLSAGVRVRRARLELFRLGVVRALVRAALVRGHLRRDGAGGAVHRGGAVSWVVWRVRRAQKGARPAQKDAPGTRSDDFGSEWACFASTACLCALRSNPRLSDACVQGSPNLACPSCLRCSITAAPSSSAENGLSSSSCADSAASARRGATTGRESPPAPTSRRIPAAVTLSGKGCCMASFANLRRMQDLDSDAGETKGEMVI